MFQIAKSTLNDLFAIGVCVFHGILQPNYKRWELKISFIYKPTEGTYVCYTTKVKEILKIFPR